MYKIFIVEDDSVIANEIEKLCISWGYDAKACKDFSNVTEEFNSYSPHLLLLDLKLPFAGGYHWCKEIRKISKLPIIFISSASDNMSIVLSMNMGADDFIAKPFDSNVLMAKIEALLRRSYDFSVSSPVLSYKGTFLNTSDNTLSFNNEKIELTKNEYRILLCLMENKNKIVSRETLMQKLWESESFVDENTLTVNINRLRKKLESFGLNGFITTKFGLGYILE